MQKFKSFLLEEKKKEEKLQHLEHPEDHFLNVGEDGYHHAISTLAQVHNTLAKKPGGIHKLSLKADGQFSVVAGHHPKTNQFFVATKSAFNKTPKVNYTEEDIDRNHGDKPDLAAKLKNCLKHLPKVIHSGIHQGDYMHDKTMRNRENNQIHFKGNVVQHSVPVDSDEGKAIMKSQIGVAFHTHYTGKDLDDLKAHHGTQGTFSSHPDVHVMDLKHDSKNDRYDSVKQKAFLTHLRAAEKYHTKKPYAVIARHKDLMKQYINHTVRQGSTGRSAEGFQKWIEEKPGIPENSREYKARYVADNAGKFNTAFKLHKHLEGAKNALIRSMAKNHGDHSFSTNGEASKPEGYVAVTKDNRPIKLIDRAEFSRNNFNKAKKKI